MPVQHLAAGPHDVLGRLSPQAPHGRRSVDLIVGDALLGTAEHASQLEGALLGLRRRLDSPRRQGVAGQGQRLLEQVWFVRGQRAEGVQVRGGAARLVPAQGDAPGVATEARDVAMHPRQHREHVLHARVAHRGVLADAEEAQRVEAVVGHDQHDVLFAVHEALRTHVVEGAGTVLEVPAVQPHEHGPQARHQLLDVHLGVLSLVRIQVEVEAVLVALVAPLGVGQLGALGRVCVAAAHSVPLPFLHSTGKLEA